jgi:hypothetical protein
VAAHRAAAAFASDIYATRAPSAPYDVLCLNAYPKDTELLQVGNALNCYRTGGALVRSGGTVVITACCATGRGYHSLHGEHMRLYRTPVQKPYLEGRDVIVFSPNLNARDFEVSFWKNYRFASSWIETVEYLDRKHAGPVSVGVVPMAPVQIFSDAGRSTRRSPQTV